MSAFPNPPRLVKGGIAIAGPHSAALQRVAVLQNASQPMGR
jgi:hypothetical protein